MSALADPSVKSRDLIEGLGKGLRVIEAFDDNHARLSSSEAAAITGISRTAARRYLLSLVQFGYAGTDGKQFWLAPRVLRLGQSYLGSSKLPRLAQPFIQRAAMQCGEAINLSLLDGHEVVYVARSGAPRWVWSGFQVGARVPAHVVSPGIVLVSALDLPQIDRWITDHEFTAFTAHTVTERSQFRAQLRQAREQDHWIGDQQLDLNFRGIAVALKDHKGRCKGALSATVTTASYSNSSMIEKLLPALRDAAQALRPLS